MIKKANSDITVIGGGFYGCMIALYLKSKNNDILLIEKESDLLTKASYNNQARVHNGYHYPRSFLTALRSHVNYSKFISDFENTIDDNYLMIYAIASNTSKVTAQQFIKFCKQIDSPIKLAPPKIKRLFNEKLIEDAFIVEEAVFNAAKLRESLKEKLDKAGIKILYQTEVIKVNSNVQNGIRLHFSSGRSLKSKVVFNCTYSQINTILKNSHLPLLPFKHEFTEMPLISVPNELSKIGVTVMDGPFFGILPFPDKNLHCLHHVRYTPHLFWTKTNRYNIALSKTSRFNYMIKDAQRYMSLLKDAIYKDSIYEVKTVLSQSESDDGRPILYRKDYGLKNFYIVMGGKIDNIYDILHKIQADKSSFNLGW